jgi:acyl carrier protein
MVIEPVTIEGLRRLIVQLREDIPRDVQVSNATRFVKDLGLSSLELIGLVFLCEQTFGVSLVSEEGLLSRLNTVGEAVAAIEDLQRRAGGAARPGDQAAAANGH